MEYKYHCQTRLKEIINGMIKVQDEFTIDKKYRCNMDKKTITIGFKKFTDVMGSLYSDMLKNPVESGLVLTPLEVYVNDQKARDSFMSVYRPIALLYNLVKAGIQEDGNLIVDPIKYFDKEYKKVKYYGWENITTAGEIIGRLCRLGFNFSGLKGKKLDKKADKFVLSFPDSPAVIKALCAYMETYTEGKRFDIEFIMCDYGYFQTRLLPVYSYEFPVFLDEKNKDVLTRLLNSIDEQYRDVCMDIFVYAVSLGYFPTSSEQYADRILFIKAFKGRFKSRSIMRIEPIQGQNTLKNPPHLMLWFSASDNYSGIFAESIRIATEENDGRYSRCYGCGKFTCSGIDGKVILYKYTYPDGRKAVICGGSMKSVTGWNTSDAPEIKRLLKIQDDLFASTANA